MRDVILAAAGAAAETDTMPARHAAAPVAAANDIAIQLGEARAVGVTEGARQGGLLERERVKSILMSESAKGREGLAQYFAFETDFPAEVALAALAKSPLAKGGLDDAMSREARPKLGAGGEHASAEPPRMISTEDIYARRRAAVAAVAKR